MNTKSRGHFRLKLSHVDIFKWLLILINIVVFKIYRQNIGQMETMWLKIFHLWSLFMLG